MALLTGTTGITKGTKAILTLDKTTLFALTPVAADQWFSVQANVKSVKVIYKSTQGNQRKTVLFELSEGSPTGNIYFSPRCRPTFEIIKIILVDSENDTLSIIGNDIPSGLSITPA